MKKIHILAAAVIFILGSCSTEKNNTDIPEAFQDETFMSDVSSYKRGYASETDKLYKELLEKDENLKALADKISKLNEDNYKGNIYINKFLSNNENYYTEVINYSSSIQDSVLREIILSGINSSEEEFKTKITNIIKLKEQLNDKIAELNDYETALKIVLTDQSIKSYQDNFKQDSSTLNSLIKQYEEIINEINVKIEK